MPQAFAVLLVEFGQAPTLRDWFAWLIAATTGEFQGLLSGGGGCAEGGLAISSLPLLNCQFRVLNSSLPSSPDSRATLRKRVALRVLRVLRGFVVNPGLRQRGIPQKSRHVSPPAVV